MRFGFYRKYFPLYTDMFMEGGEGTVSMEEGGGETTGYMARNFMGAPL